MIETCFRPKTYYTMIPAMLPPILIPGSIYIFVFLLDFAFSCLLISRTRFEALSLSSSHNTAQSMAI